jgi:hypothetical protein
MRPCRTWFVHMATMAQIIVMEKKMKPNPSIQKVRKPRIRQIQPAFRAEDFGRAESACGKAGAAVITLEKAEAVPKSKASGRLAPVLVE